ncbi:hypothetical protein N0V93_002626 [Gnomoniopsis smithogilvyi]|uniref:S-adenosyl-L-methionine-dependent methyltransferase n=1 Tax=Gnomoniopsis smithogilvyi TaxID=1191159 RepID=A0A9W9CYD5_9PEZI|nr:hypothetical protein N0V93_002626 [Gnomoniopsis smithogilvyi]
MASPSSNNSVNSSGERSYRQAPKGSTIPDSMSIEENGRLYNAYREGKYFLPNDGDEQDRLDLQHHVSLLSLDGKLCLAPFKKTATVLDIGTGTGIWAIQFARLYPHTKVIGTDISLIQPVHNTPPNCEFIREDAEDMWVFDHLFDYIHWRVMFSCFTSHKDMISKVFSNLNPGGWAEFFDWGCETIGADAAAEERLQRSSWAKWANYLVAGGAAIGRDFTAARKYKQYMIEAGFVDVVEKQILNPLNGWPLDPRDKKLGDWTCLDMLQGVAAVTKLLHLGGLPPEETSAFLEGVRYDLTDATMRVYVVGYIVYGRKPEV